VRESPLIVQSQSRVGQVLTSQ